MFIHYFELKYALNLIHYIFLEMAESIVIQNKEIRLSSHARDVLFRKKFNELKVKVYLNFFELFAFFCVTIILSYFFIFKMIGTGKFIIFILISGIISSILTYLFYKVRGYQLLISKSDKEKIYMKVSKELLETKTKYA